MPAQVQLQLEASSSCRSGFTREASKTVHGTGCADVRFLKPLLHKLCGSWLAGDGLRSSPSNVRLARLHDDLALQVTDHRLQRQLQWR